MPSFNHLHCHTQFSLLDGAASIAGMMKKAAADGMKAVALTDHGNMFGAFKFVAEAEKNAIKPIVGCEFYLVADRHQKKFSKEAGTKDVRFHQLLLAKNPEGYQNISKLCSFGFTEGAYGKYPRIDKELLLKYHKGIIATSCCIGAEIPQTILQKGEAEAEKALLWWLDLFGREDYYIELQRHGLEDLDGTGISQEDINQILLRFAKKHDLKVICTNDSHYLNESDFDPHDTLLCLNTGEKKSTPIGHGKGFRFGFPNNKFFFKTQAEMNELFKDVPQAVDFTTEIADKVEILKLKRDILMPKFPMPANFQTQDDFLKHLAFEGAKTHYDSITAELEERINFELDVIKKMGFPGYFLIVQDFINSARKLGVAVGPGRGSAAGSVVAFCTGITNIDPIKYNLLFERFLNPERVSMPDIDIDFDDQGRAKVIDYVVEKYGRNQVAQIVTYGTMAAKMSIKDVARVMDLPLDESNKLAKLVPEKAGTTLKKAFEESAELEGIRKGNDLRAKILQNAQVLEGSVRGTGIHAAGVIIAPDNIMNYIPVCTSKDSELWVTQFDGKVIEEAGMLKMDFLGLKTLTIIRDALILIKKNHGIDINIDKIPLEDKKTFELYQRGDTVGTFQFESDGMRKYLRELKPTNIEDLIAMNALYRPGPLAFIPVYIERKHGRETVEYAHPLLKQILESTFGIMIYQEQIMQTAQLLAGYTLGGADLLRRAMGKKKKEEMEKQRAIFIKGALEKNNIPKEKADEIFSVMEKFAEYGFNRSHSAAYSVVAYQTAYLKANYTAEYMAAVMTHSMGTIEKITFFMDECKRIGVQVLGPDINESSMAFDVNKKNQIRFGMGAVKGTGDAAVEEIIKERNEKGNFASIYDFAERVNLKTVSKKTFESLAYSGAFDCFPDLHRSQYFHIVREGESTGIEKIIRYGTNKQANKGKLQVSMFGGSAASAEEDKPKLSECPRWSELEKLKHEKDVVGFYISGHPLEDFRGYLNKFCSCFLSQIENHKNQEVKVGGVITAVTIKQGRDNTQFALFTIEDFDKSVSLALFNDYPKYKDLLQIDNFVIVKGKVLERNGNWELRPNSLELLTKEMQEGSVKQVSLQIDLQKLNSENLSALEKLVQNHLGNCELRLQIIDPQNRQTIDKISKKYKIKPTSELLAGLKQLEMEYKVE